MAPLERIVLHASNLLAGSMKCSSDQLHEARCETNTLRMSDVTKPTHRWNAKGVRVNCPWATKIFAQNLLTQLLIKQYELKGSNQYVE